MTRRSGKGFSLVEVLVVVVVLLIIAAIAIPQYFRARMLVNEAAAVASLRAVTTVQGQYISTYNQGYAPSLAALGPAPGGGPPSAAAADLIDVVLASGIKSGYSFVYSPIDVNGDGQPDRFTLNANPVSPGQTGEKHFYVDETNVIRFSTSGPAGPGSTPVPR